MWWSVDQAQMAMVQVAKDLAAKGEIMLAGAGGGIFAAGLGVIEGYVFGILIFLMAVFAELLATQTLSGPILVSA